MGICVHVSVPRYVPGSGRIGRLLLSNSSEHGAYCSTPLPPQNSKPSTDHAYYLLPPF
uniref:Uncharacterized protein n=1 Tax=Anguilla anguilla TaxID=7936 RepID=A0A0E9Q6U0_ANGAN